METIQNIQEKWSNVMNREINHGTIANAFKCVISFSPSVYQYCNQCQLLHRRAVPNKLSN